MQQQSTSYPAYQPDSSSLAGNFMNMQPQQSYLGVTYDSAGRIPLNNLGQSRQQSSTAYDHQQTPYGYQNYSNAQYINSVPSLGEEYAGSNLAEGEKPSYSSKVEISMF
jgi:hypothetical protein